jgi:hypothetical protein
MPDSDEQTSIAAQLAQVAWRLYSSKAAHSLTLYGSDATSTIAADAARLTGRSPAAVIAIGSARNSAASHTLRDGAANRRHAGRLVSWQR